MKYTVKQYAQALMEALEENESAQRNKILKSFLLLLRRNNDWSKLDSIIKQVEKKYLRKIGKKKVLIEFVGALSVKIKERIKDILGTNILLVEKENPKILAGLKIFIEDEILIDASARTRLDCLFND